MKKAIFFMMAFAAVSMGLMVSCGKEDTKPVDNAQTTGADPAPADTTGGATPHVYEPGHPLYYLDTIYREIIPFSQLKILCHNTEWEPDLEYLSARGYTLMSTNSDHLWRKQTQYQCLEEQTNVTNYNVQYIVSASRWGQFSGHAYMQSKNINDQIATKLVDTLIAQLYNLLNEDTVSITEIKLIGDNGQSAVYTDIEEAIRQFKSTWKPESYVSNYSKEFRVKTTEHRFFISTKCESNHTLGMGFLISHGLYNLSYM